MPAQDKRIRVLWLDPTGSSPLRALVESIPLVSVCLQPGLNEGLEHLSNETFDAVVIDLQIAVPAPATIARLHGVQPSLPIIVLAPSEQEDVALGLLRSGVHDYLLKEELDINTATRALRYALNVSRLQRRVQDLDRHLEMANHRLRELFLPATERPPIERVVERSSIPRTHVATFERSR